MPTKQEVNKFLKDVSISVVCIAAGMTVIYLAKSNQILVKETIYLRNGLRDMNKTAYDSGLLNQLVEYSKTHQ